MAELYDLHHFKSDAEHLEFIDSLLEDNKYLFPIAKCVEGGIYTVQIQRREFRKLLANGQHQLDFLAEAIPRFIYIEFYHQANNRIKYADGFHNSMIDGKDGQITSPQILVTCNPLSHALREWQ
jgi:hypothetical protein